MIASFALILFCQLVGEAFVRGIGLPMPGPVVGMIVLLALLALRERFRMSLSPEMLNGRLEATGKGLLANLSLLFVPAGVGVIQRLDLLGTYGLALAVTLVVSTAAALLATVLTFACVSRLIGGGSEAEEPAP